MLEGINKVREVEKYDLMSQLIISGNNLYGDIEAEPDK